MPRRSLVIPTVLLTLAAILSASGPASAYASISGAGSTHSQVAVDQWRRDVSQTGLQVNYSGTGSADGRNQFRSGTVDFGVSELPYGLTAGGSPDPLPSRPFEYVPLTATGLAIVYNLRIGGQSVSDLKLSPAVILGIFTGKITSWSDPSIVALNPTIKFPSTLITPVVRSDESGTSFNLTSYLAHEFPQQWLAYSGSSQAMAAFPLGTGMLAQVGSLGVAGYVGMSSTVGTIGYVEESYASNAGLATAQVLNASGRFISPDGLHPSVALMAASLNADGSADLAGVFDNPAPEAYPLSYYAYLLMPTSVSNNMTVDKADALGNFLYYAVCEGQSRASLLGFAPLPPNLAANAINALRVLETGFPGLSLASLTLTNCQNPTLKLPPGQVVLSLTNRTATTVRVGWPEPAAFSPVTHYMLRYSSDGIAWTQVTVPPNTKSYTVTGLSPHSARIIEVSAVTAFGVGPWSEPSIATTTGLAPVRVFVRTASNLPVVGGAITWAMVPRTAWSSHPYGLTSVGSINFPAIPAGTVRIRLTDGQLPDGTLVSGSWNALVSGATLTVRLPAPSVAAASYRIYAKLSGGRPLANVVVSIAGLSKTVSNDGFTFRAPDGGRATGVTDSAGLFVASGYPLGRMTASGIYDDGVLSQQASAVVLGPATTLIMPNATYAAPMISAAVASAGAPVSITVLASTPSSGSARASMRPQLAASGVRITAVLPPGASSGKCGARLTGVTGVTGRVTLRLCATRSGEVRFRSVGSLVGRSVSLRVRNSPPLAPRSVAGSSPAIGRLRVSVSSPVYTGGSTITSYRIVLSCSGCATVTRILAGHTNNARRWVPPASTVTVTGLKNAQRYLVRVYAVNKFGVSPPSSVSAPVA